MNAPISLKKMLRRKTRLEQLQQLLMDLLYSIEEHQQEITAMRAKTTTGSEAEVALFVEKSKLKINALIVALELFEKKLKRI